MNLDVRACDARENPAPRVVLAIRHPVMPVDIAATLIIAIGHSPLNLGQTAVPPPSN
jgi:hypothetical protein